MSRNDALQYTNLLYSRVPGNYRVYDQEQGYPLLALLRVIAEQAANIRQDLDALWDNFFIETADDWAVPYLASLLGTNLLAHPVGQSNRLDVKNTVLWRRSKGTPAMLRLLAQSIAGWPTDLAEFFAALGWSQNVNHMRLDHPLTVDVRDPARLALLGRAADPFAHAAGFAARHPLDQPRRVAGSPRPGVAAWGTPGRYNIKELGFFARRLETFPVRGAMPAPVGVSGIGQATVFAFDPLGRDVPLFAGASGETLDRAAFAAAPWTTFGVDVAVRQYGVLLATDAGPVEPLQSSRTAFTFGDVGVTLHAAEGLRLLESDAFQLGAAHFVLTASVEGTSGTTAMGSLSTLYAALGRPDAYHQGSHAPRKGRLVVTVQLGRPGLGWSAPAAPAARFPGAVLAVRAARTGPQHGADGLYVYLPPTYVQPGQVLTYFVADDGSTYTSANLDLMALARPSEGQVYPPRPVTNSTAPSDQFTVLSRGPRGLVLPDPARFGGAAALVEVSLFTGAFQVLGAIATVDQASAQPGLQAPDPWPAFTYAPSLAAVSGDVPTEGLLSVRLATLGGSFIPAAELCISSRTGQSLLVYLPEVDHPPAGGVRLFVASDGSTWYAPGDSAAQMDVRGRGSYAGLALARAASGQVLPYPGAWPLRQRRPVAIDLCRPARAALLASGELGIDPERGRFALPPADPAIGQAGFTVDYVEGFGDRVGAHAFDRQLDPAQSPTRLVCAAGDARWPENSHVALDHIHTSLADALSQAVDGDVIEIADSATYTSPGATVFDRPGVRHLTVRAAAGQRPCLLFAPTTASPAAAGGLVIGSPLDHLELNGLLISGGPVLIQAPVLELWLTACTLDPLTAGASGSLIAIDADRDHRARFLVCRSILGGIRTAAGVEQITVADSIVDQQRGLAIGGPQPPFLGWLADPPSSQVQLERVTVLGRLRCAVLVASECILDDVAVVDDQQVGCVRFSRYEQGSALPRRYQCLPRDGDPACAGPFDNSRPRTRCLAPMFSSRRFGRPDYAQLASVCPPAILQASEENSEIGAFASALNTLRLSNLNVKLNEFLPAGLSALVIAES